jgi:D-sedoheptulose 7-phosphate isomerase
MSALDDISALIRAQFLLRNEISAAYIPDQSRPLAEICYEMADRFRRGGRLLAVGVGAHATDAQHISVEFVHPVIVGKRALPALDLSIQPCRMLEALARPDDIVMAFGPPDGDAELDQIVRKIEPRGSLVCLWPGRLGRHELPAASTDAFIHQELTELMYHTLWETVHVFFDQQTRGEDVGAAAFLYPFLGTQELQTHDRTLADVAFSIRQKATDDERLRIDFAEGQTDLLARAAVAIRQRIDAGGALLAFGNGGSATDANDLVLDCVAPPGDMRPISAISFSLEPANISAIGNDVGVELIFLRQLIANGRPQDVVVAISTSGKSKNISAALREARKRGLLTVALTGYDGGDVARENLADYLFVVHSDYIPRIQEVQASIYHVLRLAIDKLA